MKDYLREEMSQMEGKIVGVKVRIVSSFANHWSNNEMVSIALPY